ncbi:MAG: Hpt domain-containing protein, partial [Thermoanaerobaculia bacterium]
VPPAPDLPPVLDAACMDRLRELERHSGRPVVKPVVDSFLARAAQDLAEMREALREADWQRPAFTAHRLKGSGLQIGFHRLAARLQELEAEGRDGRRAETAEGHLNQVEDELRQAVAALRRAPAG